jgi:hypothetical protein
MNDLRDLKENSDDPTVIRRKMEQLQKVAMQMGQQAYGGQQQPGAAGPTPGPNVGPGFDGGPGQAPGAGEGPDVVEGEYREVN